MDDAVMQELKRRLAESDRLDVSRYQFINMERLKRAAGQNWPEMRARVFLATRSMIERRVADDDLLIPCATGYLVIFKALSGKLAEQTTQRIAEDMERFFLGDKDLSELNVEAIAEQLSIAEFQAALAAADIELSEDEDKPGDHAGTDVAMTSGLEFYPVWDASKEAAASYFAAPVGASLNLDGPASPVLKPDKAEPRLEFDLDVLERAAMALERLIDTGSRCAVIVPAGFANVSLPRTRSRYVTELSRLPDALKSLIWVRLEDAPLNAPAAVMAETGRILLSQSANLFIDAPLDALSLGNPSETGANWVGGALSSARANIQRHDVERFKMLAQRQNLSTFIDGAHTRNLVSMAAQCGVRLIAGRAIGQYDAPRAPFRLPRSVLLSNAA